MRPTWLLFLCLNSVALHDRSSRVTCQCLVPSDERLKIVQLCDTIAKCLACVIRCSLVYILQVFGRHPNHLQVPKTVKLKIRHWSVDLHVLNDSVCNASMSAFHWAHHLKTLHCAVFLIA